MQIIYKCNNSLSPFQIGGWHFKRGITQREMWVMLSYLKFGMNVWSCVQNIVVICVELDGVDVILQRRMSPVNSLEDDEMRAQSEYRLIFCVYFCYRCSSL